MEGGRKPHIIRYQLSKALKPYIEYRESMFERVYPITEKLADHMIAVGYKQPSRFGRWCPIQVSGIHSRPAMESLPLGYINIIWFYFSPVARGWLCAAHARTGFPIFPCRVPWLCLLPIKCSEQRDVHSASGSIPQTAFTQTCRTDQAGYRRASQVWQDYS